MLTVRDLLSWVAFINMTERSLGPEYAFLHGAFLVLLDGISLGIFWFYYCKSLFFLEDLHIFLKQFANVFLLYICVCVWIKYVHVYISDGE